MLSDLYNYRGIPKLLYDPDLLAHHLMSVIPSLVFVYTNCRSLLLLVLLKGVGELGTFLYAFAALRPQSRFRVSLYKYGMTVSNMGMLLAWCGVLYSQGWEHLFSEAVYTVGVVMLCWGRQDCMLTICAEWAAARGEELLLRSRRKDL